tara:strand:- start:411 stop:707 length:297 start_codon:yes stop_codon:yes gene_type:complete
METIIQFFGEEEQEKRREEEKKNEEERKNKTMSGETFVQQEEGHTRTFLFFKNFFILSFTWNRRMGYRILRIIRIHWRGFQSINDLALKKKILAKSTT